jgi:large subunit ribosomal protein L17
MRHRNAHRKLGRTSSHRKALLKNMSIALIAHGKIETTVQKAKELRSYIEKLITAAKDADFNTHRYVFAELQDKTSTKRLIEEVAPQFKERNGGYTSIRRTRMRRGDAAEMATISFVG